MRGRLRTVLIGLVLLLGLGTAVIPGAASAAAPTIVVDALTVPTNAQPGQNVAASAKVRTTSGSLRVQAITIAVRLAGKGFDFPGARENVTVTTGGYTFTSAPRTFTAGAYDAFVAVRVNNRWTNLAPVKRFVVAAAAPGKVVLDSLTMPTTVALNASVTASARLHSTGGTVSAQAVTVAVRKSGAAFDFPGAVPATIPTSGYTFTSKARTFTEPGTYEASAAVQVNGKWTNLAPTKRFTVGGNCDGPVDNTVTFCQDFKGNANGGANAGLRADNQDRPRVPDKVWQSDTCWANKPSCDGVTSQYRDDVGHVRQDGENLVLTADRKPEDGAKCPTEANVNALCDAASARLTMLNWRDPSRPWGQPAWTQKGGHFEISASLPTGDGLWPAFWTHGDPTKSGAWPKTGEIDVFENLGHESDKVHHVVHGGPGDWRSDVKDNGDDTTAAVSGGVATFHTYAIDWKSGPNGYITWSIDNNPTRTLTAAQANRLQSGLWAILDQPQALIVDLKVNGTWNREAGKPLPTGDFSKQMKIDYIKVLANPLR